MSLLPSAHRAVTVGTRPTAVSAPTGPPPADASVPNDRPRRRAVLSASIAWELGGSAAAALAFVWVIFTVAGLSAPFGMLISWCLTFITIYGIVCWKTRGPLVMKDRLATVVLWTGALCALIPLVAVILYVAFQGIPVAFARFPHFFVADMSNLGSNAPVTAVGVGAAIVGSLEQVGIAAVLTVPLGILCAMYLADHQGPFARLVGNVVDATTGAPAIICGIFIYIIWVAPQKVNGKSGLAAGFALAVMMLPIVTRASQEVISIVPGSLREAALALGAPKWRVVVRVVLPTARAGIATAVILGIARVAGETAPVLFDAGGNSHFNWNPFHGFQDNLPLRVFNLIFQGQKNLTRDAWGASFVLVLVVLVLFVVARRVGASGSARKGIVARIASRAVDFRTRRDGVEAVELDPTSTLLRSEST